MKEINCELRSFPFTAKCPRCGQIDDFSIALQKKGRKEVEKGSLKLIFLKSNKARCRNCAEKISIKVEIYVQTTFLD